MKKPIRIGALISGTGSNLDAIIGACSSGQINGRVVFAGADNPGAKGLEKAKNAGIPTFVVNYTEIIRQFKAGTDRENRMTLPPDFDPEALSARQSIVSHSDMPKLRAFLATRSIAEAELLKAMTHYPFDLLVLAGFMRNLTPYFIDRVNTDPANPRIMNIHPALLPAFPGTDGYGDTFRYGCKVGGCTVHFVDYGEDSGPVIGQRCFSIDDGDTLDIVKKKGLEQEWQLYPECIRLFAENRLKTVKMTHKRANGKIFTRTVVKIVQPA